MGIPGAGKSRVAEEHVARGYLRLNRDERGGTLRELADALDEALVGGCGGGSCSTTPTSRARRGATWSRRPRGTGSRRGASGSTRRSPRRRSISSSGCSSGFGSLPGSGGAAGAGAARARACSRRRRRCGRSASSSRRRPRRGSPASSACRSRARRPPGGRGRASSSRRRACAVRVGGRRPTRRHGRAAPVFDWRPESSPGRARDRSGSSLAAVVSGPVAAALCPHPGGPPTCWCRPPLPGLSLAFARAHGVDPARSVLVGTAAAHRTLASALGARYVQV